MPVLDQINSFSAQYGKRLAVNGTTWRYYRIGRGAPVFWLTGGLRRSALGFAFMERLAARHTIIAPDYPPELTIDEYIAAFDAILNAEGIGRFMLCGQSYGGMLAQAYLARKGAPVKRLILSSSGPANYGKAWLPVDDIAIALARLLPEKTVKNILAGGLIKFVNAPEAKRAEWAEAVQSILQNDLTRADVISHFAVPSDLIQKKYVVPAAYQDWPGRVVILSAENDPTQSKKDIPKYEKLFGRAVEVVSMGQMGHTAALFNPDQYVELLEKALGEEE